LVICPFLSAAGRSDLFHRQPSRPGIHQPATDHEGLFMTDRQAIERARSNLMGFIRLVDEESFFDFDNLDVAAIRLILADHATKTEALKDIERMANEGLNGGEIVLTRRAEDIADLAQVTLAGTKEGESHA
jgi:hypothetical protein